MNILDGNGIDIEMQVGIGKIPDAADAAVAEDTGDFSCILLRHGQDTDIGLIGCAIVTQLAYIINRDAGDFGTDHSRIAVECSHQLKAVAEEIEVVLKENSEDSF